MTEIIKRPQTICAVDVGSNSIKMRIARIEHNKRHILHEMRYPVRLGASVFSSGRLDSAAIQQTCTAFEEIVRLAQTSQVTRYRAVATSATREAVNGLQLCEAVRQRTGWDLEIISGMEEARLVALGLRSDFNPDRSNLVIDVGGGSTEVIFSHQDRIQPAIHSLSLGAVRLKQLAASETSGEALDLQRMGSLITQEISLSRLDELPTGVNAIGVAGTIRALGNVLNQHFSGTTGLVQLQKLKQLVEELSVCPEADIANRYGVDESRAEILLPGALIVYHVMNRLGIESMTISSGGVRDGLLEELTCTESMVYESAYIRIGTKYQFERHHEAQVAKLATSLYDQLQPLHQLPVHWKTCLQASAWLHDIGQFISYTKHHKHSWYLIMNEALPEDLQKWQAAIACIARYHRKAHPRPEHQEYMALPEAEQKAVAICAGILRVADALDRRHLQKVKSCDISTSPNNFALTIYCEDRAADEKTAVTKKGALLSEIFGREINVQVEATTR